jgi:hypothetical protein
VSRNGARHWIVAVIIATTLAAAGHRAAAQTWTLTPRLSVSEQYNDNVFFDDRNEEDFITSITPAATLVYQRPLLSASLSGATSGQIYARQTAENRFAESQSGVLLATYRASPRLNLRLADGVTHVRRTRTGDVEPLAEAPPEPPPEGEDPGPAPQVATLLPRGSALSNFFNTGVSYALAPRWSTSASYQHSYSDFTDPSGRDVVHRARGSLGYTLRPDLSTSLSYAYSRFDLNEETASDTESHSINAGAGYQIDPYWSASASAGVFINRPLGSTDGTIDDRIGPLFSVTLARLTERGSFQIGAAQNITTSAGVAGLSQTRSAFGQYQARLTESLNGRVGVRYSNFDTNTVDYDLLVVTAGISMPFWRYFNAGVTYVYRYRDSSQTTARIEQGTVDGNLVSIFVGASYPIPLGT